MGTSLIFTSSTQSEVIQTTNSEIRYTTTPSPTQWPTGRTTGSPPEVTTTSETVTKIIPSIEIFTLNSTTYSVTSAPEIQKVTSASPIQDLSENTTVQNEETTRQVETTNTFEISTQEIPVTVIDIDQVDDSDSSSGSGDFFFKNDSSAIAGNLTLDYGPTENPILIMEEETTTDSPLIDTTLLVEVTTSNDVTTTFPKPNV